ncbi:ABC transporter permease [Saccharopolyspora rosea]|uniref:ABC transporter permease n=1 Tax=Saccharopolyspora rosea TaxID=524884 RepID=A0ABW3FPF3_9PSEU|nr:ABC transporter permease [Saccharopolyspora rosea]
MTEDTERPGTAIVPTERHTTVQPDGSVEGYRAGRTLPVRVELARQLRRRRTRLSLGFLVVLPVLLLIAFQVGSGSQGGRSLADTASSSGLNFAVFTLFASTNFLLVVVVALFFGDTVASEASWSSLKYLLAAPVPRSRLLRRKAVVSAILSGVGLLLLTAVALGVGLLWYGGGDLLTPTGEALPFPVGVASLAVAAAYLAVHLTWIAGLSLWLGVNTDAPLGAVGGAVLVSILSQILDQITALGDLRAYLPTHYATAYSYLLSSDVDWTSMARGAFSGLAYATVFTALAIWRFRRKDITS